MLDKIMTNGYGKLNEEAQQRKLWRRRRFELKWQAENYQKKIIYSNSIYYCTSIHSLMASAIVYKNRNEKGDTTLLTAVRGSRRLGLVRQKRQHWITLASTEVAIYYYIV